MSWVRTATIWAIIAALGALLAACGSRGTKLQSARATTSTAPSAPATTTTKNPLSIGVNYHPKIVPAKFTNHVTNRYFPLVPGKTLHYTGVRDGKPTEHTFTVTRDKQGYFDVTPRTILSGREWSEIDDSTKKQLW